VSSGCTEPRRAPLTVVLASSNVGKAREFSRLLGGRFVVEPLPPDLKLPPENGATFLENALLKGRAVFSALEGRTAVLADDSGLEVEALGGRPGVRSARYAGDGADDSANMAKVLADMRGATDRRARFVCALALLLADGRELTAEGTLKGEVAPAPRGERGFGYDPVFRPDGWRVTLAEASGEEKDAVSHRGDAVRRLVQALERETSVSDG
jgi:XTP/dITP diphosphohydrolase